MNFLKIKSSMIANSYLSFPMYILFDLDILSEFINIVYSVQVGQDDLCADRRNLPFSTSTPIQNGLHYVR
jgi:hypothetical protein